MNFFLNLFYTLYFILQFVEPRCEDFNGIPHPDNIRVCCSKQCGTVGEYSCGGRECEAAPGKAPECCMGLDRKEKDGIITNGRVCSKVTHAPCNIGKYIYFQISNLTVVFIYNIYI